MAASHTDIIHLEPTDARYPAGLRCLGDSAARRLACRGSIDALRPPLLGLICSVQCPGSIILKAYDAARALRDAGVAVAGGFHSPMEMECLALLLRGAQPVVVCPAKNIEHMRIPRAWRQPLEEGRLLLLSPFPKTMRRTTKQSAVSRNRLVAALASHVLIVHASPNGKTEQLCQEALSWRKPVFTIADHANAHIVALGARPGSVGQIIEWCGEASEGR